MKKLIKEITQIGLVVDDMDAYIERYTEEYGIGPWEVVRFGKEIFPGLMIDGKPGELEMRCAFCKVPGLEIELIEPISESIFSKFLRENGSGIHHIAIESDRSFHEILEMAREKGEKPLMHLQKSDGKDILAYLDLKKEVGFCVEIFGEEGKRESK